MPNVTMPRLSDSMEEGTIITWHVSNGDTVEVGQELAEVETDKATVGFEAEVAGVIRLLAGEGETVALGAVIAVVGDDEQIHAEGAKVQPAQAIAPAQAPPENAAAAPSASKAIPTEARPLASPLARRIAEEHGVDLRSLTGSGPRGRIVRADVEEAVQRSSNGDRARTATLERPDVSTAKGEVERFDLSRVQQVVARRMAESRATVPDFAVAVEVDMGEAWALRAELKRSGERERRIPSLNDVVVLACGRALREFPKANSSYVDGRIETFSRVNVGVAIAGEESLVVATVFDADQQTLGGIAAETGSLAERVRDGSIAPPALAGATFTVSNLGMLGVDHFTAVVNAPQAAILAVGAVKEKPVARAGEVIIRRCMTMTLSADHRVLYGVDAARFLARIRELLESPLTLLAG